ncbi:MAG: type II secretion system F family protein [Terracoccus sp.]
MRGATVRRVVAVAVAAVALVLPGASLAVAADPVTVGISDLTASGSTLTGVLTLRSRSAVRVDAGSLKARVDGQDAPISITQAPMVGRRAMLVIDTSGSMKLSGMATVRAATAQYLKDVPADVLVGVATFSDTAGVDLAPTADRPAVQRVVNGLAARGDTSLYAGMRSAISALGPKGDRSIVLLSDGADTKDKAKEQSRLAVTAALKAAGVRTDVVQFQTTDPEAVVALRGFAGANGGSVVAAGDTAAVTAAFRDSAKALDSQVEFTINAPAGPTKAHAVTLTGTAGSQPFAFSRTLDFGDAAAVPTPTPSAPAPAPAPAALPPLGPLPTVASQDWLPWVASGLVALALFALGTAVVLPSLQTRRERRVAAVESYVMPLGTAMAHGRARQTPVTEQLTAFGDRVMKDRKGTEGTMSLMERADLPFRAGEWFIVHVCTGVVATALVFVVMRGAGPLGLLIALLMGGGLGFALPTVALRFLAARRAKKFERVLPDVLMLVATSLRSGFGLPQALDAVARDAAEPAAKEFSRALAETRIGTDVSDALTHMADRMDSTAMRWTVMAIRIQREVGGNLADTLLTTAKTLREREGLRRMVATLSAEGKLSAYILVALPIGLFGYMCMVNYEYVSLLWSNALGIAMLVATIVMLGIGILWMRKVVQIEV